MSKTSIIFSALYLLLIISFNAKSQPTPPFGQVWLTVSELTDEFNDTSLDRSKWLNYHPYWSGREPSLFDTNNIAVSGGYLRLKSTVSNYNQTGYWIASSCVTSKTKAMQSGYYSEARIKCPTLSMTGAYWFQGTYSEIDVAENFGAPTGPAFAGYETYMNSALHYFVGGFANDKYTNWNSSILQPSCADTFFTYGVWWKDSVIIIIYLNGKEVQTLKPAGPFNENMYLFFDMEAYNWGIGLPTIASLDDSTKNTQYVDWVHTFKLENLAQVSVPDFFDSEKDIRIFPNPVSGSFSTNKGGTTEIEIYDIKGVLVCRREVSEKESFPTCNIPSGIYVAKIITPNSITTQRLIIEEN